MVTCFWYFACRDDCDFGSVCKVDCNTGEIRFEFKNHGAVYHQLRKGPPPEFCFIRHDKDALVRHYIRESERMWYYERVGGMDVKEIVKKFSLTPKVARNIKSEAKKWRREQKEQQPFPRQPLSPTSPPSSTSPRQKRPVGDVEVGDTDGTQQEELLTTSDITFKKRCQESDRENDQDQHNDSTSLMALGVGSTILQDTPRDDVQLQSAPPHQASPHLATLRHCALSESPRTYGRQLSRRELKLRAEGSSGLVSPKPESEGL